MHLNVIREIEAEKHEQQILEAQKLASSDDPDCEICNLSQKRIRPAAATP